MAESGTNKDYKITVYTITNEKLYASDLECDHYDKWSADFKIFVGAESIQQALEKAKAAVIKDGIKWRSVDHNEEFKPRHFHCHSIRNDEYTDKLRELYG